jgi:hypothetical protein
MTVHVTGRWEPTFLALPDLTSIGTSILTLLGSALMAVVGVRMFTAYAKKNWGEFITEGIAVIFVGWFIWFPDSAKITIQALIHQVFG